MRHVKHTFLFILVWSIFLNGCSSWRMAEQLPDETSLSKSRLTLTDGTIVELKDPSQVTQERRPPTKKLMYLSTFILCLPFLGCAAMKPAVLDSTWPYAPVLEQEASFGGRMVNIYLLDGASEDDWTELLTVFSLPLTQHLGDSEVSLREMYEQILGHTDNCQRNILDDTVNRFSFEGNCSVSRDYNLTTVICGSRDCFVLTYAVRNKEVDPNKRDEWLNAFREAEVKGG